MAARDPDAIWKPGYSGPVVYAQPAQARPRRRRRLAVIIAGMVAAIAVGLLVSRIVVGGDAGESSKGERIPTQVREQWTTKLGGPVFSVTGTTDSIVAMTGADPALVALDAGTGAERWRVPASAQNLTSMDVIDDVVVVQYFSAEGGSLAGFDVQDGRRLWSVQLRRAREALVADERVVGSLSPMAESGIDLYDPATGARLGSIEGDEVSISSASVRRRAGDVVELFDRNTFAPKGRIDLAGLGLDRFAVSAASTDAGLVVATFDRAILIDDDGTVVSSLALSRRLDAPWVLDELDGSGRFLVLRGRSRTTLLTVREGALGELWTRPAQVVGWFVDESHQVLALQPVIGQPLPPPMEVVEATSGRTIWSGQESTLRVAWTWGVLGRNGFIAAVEDEPSTLGGYRLDGTLLWRLPVADRAWITFVPGALISVDVTTPASPTLTLFS